MPKISIIIPLYNKGFIFQKTLESVLQQSFTDFELIVVNDGSDDNSVEILKSYHDSRIKLYHQDNQGVGTARNFGIEKATSELIAFLDADDYWLPDHLEEIYLLYQDFPDCGIYASRYFMKIATHKNVRTFYKNIAQDFRGVVNNFFDASLPYRIGLTSSLAIPKSIFTEKRFNPTVTSGQDLELYTKIALEYPVALTSAFTVEYNFSLDNQLSKTPITRKRLMNFEQFSEKEKSNGSLQRFLDLYRLEYAMQFKIAGDLERSEHYFKTIKTSIPFKTKLLYKMPGSVLKKLLRFKQFLRSKGFDFSIYN
ncbi:glycosyltransferase family 2 protein [Flavobacterium sp. NRK F10]|uniref:Glycosyltransferase 2-like domain-containing protein n=1 Tax=Flavobacterium sediminis TaxID=2201181 RepID=A0A2U8QR71_9FLAO|nr:MULTISPECIES: glycosyltransferase family A protein [Flavobacterium]AWM12627.1 hypothetical protein DI487_01250 [Flavobacterium sediminis]MCO6173745.1 glycosyltransferase family 2 protein [Flavobacterium sp. NRK F10]